MLAVPDRREFQPRYGDLSRFSAPTPSPVFRAAYKELCARIWIELELLAQAAGQVQSGPRRDLEMGTATLRLELIVLVDACRSPQWRCMLSTGQRDNLCSMLTDVLAALYVDSEYLAAGFAEAQARVLDELLRESEVFSRAAPACTCQLEHASASPVDELVSLLEERALALTQQTLSPGSLPG